MSNRVTNRRWGLFFCFKIRIFLGFDQRHLPSGGCVLKTSGNCSFVITIIIISVGIIKEQPSS